MAGHCSAPPPALRVDEVSRMRSSLRRPVIFNESPERDTSWNGKFSSIVVPAGELTRITFSMPSNRDEFRDIRRGLFSGQPPPEVDVGYADLSGRLFRTKLFLRWNGAVWFVSQVYIYRHGEDQPFVTTGPSAP